MTTREKVIVGLMILTIIYGAFDLMGNLGDKGKRIIKNANPAEDLKDFTASVTKKLVNEKVSSEYRYLIKQASNDWSKDPFIQSTTPLKKQLTLPSTPTKPTVSNKTQDFTYSGFLMLGSTKLAVINGREFAEGESLDTRGLFVKSISAKRVVIGGVDGGDTIQLPITETGPTDENQEP